MTTTKLVMRLLLVQGLWNYRTMIGAGLAWVLLPALERAARGDHERLRAGLSRQAQHFNAHPYLAGFAVGSLARLEDEGEEPETLRRFRDALRGPLGSLGDGLVWVGWLPACVLAAGVVGALTRSPLVAVAGFLVVYNALHLTLRWWGVQSGLALGKGVGQALRRANLQSWAERIGGAGVLLLGLLIGFFTTAGLRSPEVAAAAPAAGLPVVAGLLLFALGFVRGRAAWWWTPVLVPGTIAGILLVQALL